MWYISGPSFIYMGNVILEFWYFKSSLCSRKYHFRELLLVTCTPRIGFSPASPPCPPVSPFNSKAKWFRMTVKKTPTYIAFFKLLLGRVKATFMLILWHFLIVFWMPGPPANPLPPSFLWIWKVLRWYISGPSFISMRHVILEFWYFKCYLRSQK